VISDKDVERELRHCGIHLDFGEQEIKIKDKDEVGE